MKKEQDRILKISGETVIEKIYKGAKKFLSLLAPFALNFIVALGASACNLKSPSSDTEDTTPPIIDSNAPNGEEEPSSPAEPEEPDTPDDPDGTEPTDPTEPETPTEPTTPTEPEQPAEPEIDYDNLTADTLTAEQKVTIVNNVTTALKNQIQMNIGNTGVVNKVIALDFEDNTITLLLDYTNNSLGNMYGLFKYTMSAQIDYKNLLTASVNPSSSNKGSSGEALLRFSQSSSDERAAEALAKLKADGVLDYDDRINADFVGTTKSGGGVNEIGGVAGYDLNRLDKERILSYHVAVKSDGVLTDFFNDYLINGTYNKTYILSKSYEYKFSENALYNFNGLENLKEYENI